MKMRVTLGLGFLLAAFLAPAPRAWAGEGFEIQTISPEEQARSEQRLRELTLPTSWVEFGTYYVTEDSYKFGDFTGLDQNDFRVLGNFDIRRRAPWDGDSTWHLRLRGYNLGLDSRSLHAEYGQQGLFDVWGDFSQMPKYQTDSMWTPYRGIGSPLLTLPPDWVSSDTTAGFTRLDQNLLGRPIDHTRRRYGGGFDVHLPWALELQASYKGENKEGRKITSAIIGSTGGNPRSAIVAEPLDYKTQEVDTKLRFNGDRGQFELGYYFSGFNDENRSLTWQNAFMLGSWDASASFPHGFGSKSTPPDNFFHQISASGGYNLPWWNTRVTGDIAFGWMRQNDSFLPYTANSTLAASITRGLPRNSLDGKINTTAANLRIDTQPLPKLRLHGRYRYDDRDNETPRDLFIYIPGDAQAQGTVSSSTARLNRPYSYKLKEYSVEGSYEVFRRTEVALGYRRQLIERDYSEVQKTDEDIYSARLTSHPFSWVSLRADGEIAERGRSTYKGNLPFLEGTTSQHLATVPPDPLFENNPNLRKFYFANRDRNRVRGTLTLTPVRWLDFSFSFDDLNDFYDDAQIGLLHARTSSYTLDVTLNPCEHFTTHAFYTNEQFRTRQEGHSFSGNSIEANLADVSRRYKVFDHDDIDTIGWGFDLTFLDGSLTFEGDAVYTRAEGDIRVNYSPMPAPVLLPGTPTTFPTIKSDLIGVTVSGRYRITENVSVRLGYTFQNLRVNDWSVDNIFPASLPRVLSTGQTTPDYRDHVVAFSVKYEFR